MSKYPKSWYVAAKSHDVKRGKIKELSLFNKSYVMYRTKNDEVVIFERHCPHMGASLLLGKIIDDCIRCSFHHWKYDKEGKCVNIPGIDNIPNRAELNKIFSREMYNLIWVWYDGTPLFELPVFTAALEFKNDYNSFRFNVFSKGNLLQTLEKPYKCFDSTILHGIERSSKLIFVNLDERRKQSLQSYPQIDETARYGVIMDYTAINPNFILNLFKINEIYFSVVVDGWPSGQFITFYLNGEELYQVMIGIQPTNNDALIKHVHVMIKKNNISPTNWFNYLLYAFQKYFIPFRFMSICKISESENISTLTDMNLGVIGFRMFYSRWT
jgi:aminopyrrolnitrin oxygenase